MARSWAVGPVETHGQPPVHLGNILRQSPVEAAWAAVGSGDADDLARFVECAWAAVHARAHLGLAEDPKLAEALRLAEGAAR